MARDEDAVLELLELTLRIKRLRAALIGSAILTDEDRAAIEATLPVLAYEVRRLEHWLKTLPPRP